MFLLTAISAVSLGAGNVALAADNASAKKEIQVIEGKIEAAMKRGDLSYIKGVLTDDFKVVDKKKTYTKAEWVQMTSQILAQVKIKSIDFQIISIQTSGNTAELVTKSKLHGELAAGKSKPKILVDSSSDKETWVKVGGAWKFKMDKTISETATLDGKPIQS